MRRADDVEPGSRRLRGRFTGRRWASALATAREGKGVANVLWLGDSISELDVTGAPLPWQVGHILSGWTETVQYRNASGDPLSPSMATTGEPTPFAASGLGGRSVDLAPGNVASTPGHGEGVTVLWTRQVSGGMLDVVWGGDRLGSIDTGGSLAFTRTTSFRRPRGLSPEEVSVTASDGTARLEGVYVHSSNLDAGVRVWPALRAGNTSRHFLEHPGFALDALDSLDPHLVVIATGTNDADYRTALAELIGAVRARVPDVDVAVWLPPITTLFTVAHASEGRALAMAEGCAVIDAAGALGSLPTADGVHPTSVTTAISAGHAAMVLDGDGDGDGDGGGTGNAAMLVAQVVSALSIGQIWQPGAGPVRIESLFGVTLLSGRVAASDPDPVWAFILPKLGEPLLDLPGMSLSFGPGGDEPIDTHLSRAGQGHVVINAGAGQLDAARLLLAEGPEPASPTAAAVLYARAGPAGAELAAKLPDGTTRVVVGSTTTPPPGLLAPVPCALAPHRRVGADVVLERAAVVWIPFPVLAAAAAVTHVWIDVAGAVVGATATAAIVGSLPDGRPGDVSTSTSVAAVDLSTEGIRGAELRVPTVVRAGERWWVAVHVEGGGSDPSATGGEDLEGWPTVQVGTAPVVPGRGATCGGLHLPGQTGIPDRPGAALTSLSGAVPVVHVSLQAP